MLNKLLEFIREYEMVQPGDRVVCALSGGADSVALVYGMKLLSEKLRITVSAAHFNHRLRGEESDRDEAFVREFCRRHDIDLTVGTAQVCPGNKGLEAAARDARYGFLDTLPGKLATAHTADDNGETVLMHLLRGSGLKGLGGIAPVRGRLIRPMLRITRREVLAFLEEYSLEHIHDSSNDEDTFLRNRLRHRVLPVLKQENPKLAENLSEMALGLRLEEEMLEDISQKERTQSVPSLRELPQAVRRRVLRTLLEEWGVPEPDRGNVELAEKLVFSEKPSARAEFPGGIIIGRNYERLEKISPTKPCPGQVLPCPGTVELPQCGLRVSCKPAEGLSNDKDCFAVIASGQMVVRSRRMGDRLCLSGGTKSLKELFIDRKIPAHRRDAVPVLEDDKGIVGVYGFGADINRLARELPAVCICFEKL